MTMRINGEDVGVGGGASLPSGTGPVEVVSGVARDPARSAGDVLAEAIEAVLADEPAGAALIGDGAGSVEITSADVSAFLAAANAASARAAIGAAGGATPDVITPTITPGAWTSGQHTVLLTVTDSLGAPRIGTPVRLTHTSTGGSYSVGSINLGSALASQQNPANTEGFLLAATDYLGRVQALWNSPPGTTTTVTAVVLSEAPTSLALTPFVGP